MCFGLLFETVLNDDSDLFILTILSFISLICLLFQSFIFSMNSVHLRGLVLCLISTIFDKSENASRSLINFAVPSHIGQVLLFIESTHFPRLR